MKTLLINAARCSSAVLLSAAVLLGTVSCGPVEYNIILMTAPLK